MRHTLCSLVLSVGAAACGDEAAPAPSAADTATGGTSFDSTTTFDVAWLDLADTKVSDGGAANDHGDGGDAGDVAQEAAGACPGGGGCSCLAHGECDSGLCLDDPGGAQGKACARPCGAACPADYVCAAVNGPGGDIKNVCVWKWGRLCDPCAASSDCTAPGLANTACVDQGALGRFCGVACLGNASCPDGYVCSGVPTAEGGKLDQCVRAADELQKPFGVCPCGAQAKAKKLQTACWSEAKGADGKLVGTCPGVRVCGDGGLTECSAQMAGSETCNGKDDDCDGLTDEGGCDDGNVCTTDACKGADGCKATALDGTGCDADGSLCTKNDTCANGNCQKGPVQVCNDGNDCTFDACLPATGCTQTFDDGVACSDDNPCTVGDSCKSGKCQAGKPKVCTPINGCTDAACAPTGACAPSYAPTGKACSDGNACTEGDACKQGTCTGTPLSCDDKNLCTADACTALGGCTHAANTAPCDDGNACTKGDVCGGTGCAGKAVDVNAECGDGNPCTVDACDPIKGCSQVAAPNGGACSGCGEATCVCSGGKCLSQCLAVDGGWTDYVWSECSAPCGGGQQTGTRSCTNPAPACGGKACVGSATQSKVCNSQACPPPALAKGTTTVDAPGKSTVGTIPAGVTQAQFHLWGGGGGGGMPGNGGGGAYLFAVMPVTAGDVIEVRVAEGGPPGSGGGATYVFKNESFFAIAAGGGGAGIDGCSGCTGGPLDGAGGGGGTLSGGQAGTINNKYSTGCMGGGGATASAGGVGATCNDKSVYTQCVTKGGDGGAHNGGGVAVGATCSVILGASGHLAGPAGGGNGSSGGGGSGYYGGGAGGAKWTYTGGGGGGGSSWLAGTGTLMSSQAADKDTPGGLAGPGYKAGRAKGGKGKWGSNTNAVEPGGAGLVVLTL